jgi:hypothetical protein
MRRSVTAHAGVDFRVAADVPWMLPKLRVAIAGFEVGFELGVLLGASLGR